MARLCIHFELCAETMGVREEKRGVDVGDAVI